MKLFLKFITVFITVALVGCKEKEVISAAPLETKSPATQAVDLARKIVSDPSNWKNNTALITELGGLAEDLKIADTAAFKDFDLAAQDLVRFGTTWITSLDEGNREQLQTELTRLTGRTEASLRTNIPVSPPVGTPRIDATIDSIKNEEQVKHDAERIIMTTVHSLRAAQADEFGRLFARAQTSYRSLRKVLQEHEEPNKP